MLHSDIPPTNTAPAPLSVTLGRGKHGRKLWDRLLSYAHRDGVPLISGTCVVRRKKVLRNTNNRGGVVAHDSQESVGRQPLVDPRARAARPRRDASAYYTAIVFMPGTGFETTMDRVTEAPDTDANAKSFRNKINSVRSATLDMIHRGRVTEITMDPEMDRIVPEAWYEGAVTGAKLTDCGWGKVLHFSSPPQTGMPPTGTPPSPPPTSTPAASLPPTGTPPTGTPPSLPPTSTPAASPPQTGMPPTGTPPASEEEKKRTRAATADDEGNLGETHAQKKRRQMFEAQAVPETEAEPEAAPEAVHEPAAEPEAATEVPEAAPEAAPEPEAEPVAPEPMETASGVTVEPASGNDQDVRITEFVERLYSWRRKDLDEQERADVDQMTLEYLPRIYDPEHIYPLARTYSLWRSIPPGLDDKLSTVASRLSQVQVEKLLGDERIWSDQCRRKLHIRYLQFRLQIA